MPPKHILTKIGEQTVKLSNLEKVLYPIAGITKAEIIQYYLSIQDLILPLIKGRPITMIRYPDGIDKQKFYSKNLPNWTPKWIKRTALSESDDNSYLVIDEASALIWCVNLASLEIHSTQTRVNHLSTPDHFIFDLDPPENLDFEEVKQLALKLRPFLLEKGYQPYIKTSGSKGLHIYVPIHPIYQVETSYESVKSLAQEFIKSNPETTLILSKEKRKGRVLLDIYRNHRLQTCAIPYSTRGKTDCPISCPIFWEDLPALESSTQYNIRNIQSYLAKGNPWEDFYDRKAYLHDDQSHIGEQRSNALSAYESKRDFKNTSEPIGEVVRHYGNPRFVLQIHDASNLHYDLRLERDGVLVSWAIPKGMPCRVGQKRLAIQTEPHPVKYLTFEGKIPKDEYGGGEMWVFDSGEYEVLKWSDSSIKFILKGKYFCNPYKIYKTKDDLWLLEVERDQPALDSFGLKPQLAAMGTIVPSPNDYLFELKWDGIRALIHKEGVDVKIFSRSGNDISDKFPAIVGEIKNIEAESAIFDSEIVVLGEKGAPLFGKVVGRMHLTGESSISRASKSSPATCYLFDCLYLDGRLTVDEPLERRRAWTRIQIKPSLHVRFSDTFVDGKNLFEAAKIHQLEGIMAKAKGSIYHDGKRDHSWVKIKVRTELEVYIIGYTLGDGDRSDTFGALHCAEILDDGSWFYRGKIGTGYDREKINYILNKLDELDKVNKPSYVDRYEEKISVWVDPTLKALINYASITPDGILREPVFMSLIE